MSNEAQSSIVSVEIALPRREAIARTIDPRDRGRRWILWGWLVTMIGVAGYCRAMFRAGPDTDILQALGQSGIAGWASLAFIALGVAVWMSGNLVFLRDSVSTK